MMEIWMGLILCVAWIIMMAASKVLPLLGRKEVSRAQ